MKYIVIILFVLSGFVAKAQLPANPVPTQFSTGYFKHGWDQTDSGFVFAVRDTNFTPRYIGTTIYWLHAGVDTAQWVWNGHWVKNINRPTTITTTWGSITGTLSSQTDLQNALNLKLNSSDTTNKWINNIRRLPGSLNVEIYKNGSWTTAYTDSISAGGGSGLTSVGLSMPSAFTVTNSPLTINGTIAVSGAGLTTDYIRGNGTLATTDTTMIPNFYLKVRSLLSGTSPITFNQITGAIGIPNANNTGTKGAATFNNSDFSDNGFGLISLASIVGSGSCTNCNITFDSKGRATAFANGSGSTGNGVDTIYRNVGVDSIYYTINGIVRAIKDSVGTGGGGTVTNVSGTTDRIVVTNPTTTPVIDIASTYVGQTSLTTLGTISTGTWNGTTIGATFGGTGQTAVTTGDVLYGSASNTWDRLPDVATGNALISGGIGGAPSWGKIGLTTHVSGILPIANGGTGTGSPSLTAGTGISITGSWPNQTITNSSLGGLQSLDSVLAIGNTGYNKDLFLQDNKPSQAVIAVYNRDTTNDNAVARVDARAYRGKAVLTVQGGSHSFNGLQFYRYDQSPGTYLPYLDSAKSFELLQNPDTYSVPQLRNGIQLAFVHPNYDLKLLSFDTTGRAGFSIVEDPQAWIDLPPNNGSGTASLRLRPGIFSANTDAGDIDNTGTFLTYTDNSHAVWNLNDQCRNAVDGSVSAPSFSFASDHTSGMWRSSVLNSPVITGNTSGSALGLSNSNSSGFNGFAFMNPGITSQQAFIGYNNAASRFRIGAVAGFSLDFEAGGFNDNNPSMRLTSGGNMLIGTTTDNGAKLQVNGKITVAQNDVTSNSDSAVVWNRSTKEYQYAKINGTGGTTIYSGDGTLAGNRTLTGNNLSLTFDTLFNFRINANAFILSQKDKGFPYTSGVVSTNPHNYQIGYTPTPTVYSKGAGLYIDTNNNVGLGVGIPTTTPLYATGNSAYVQGFQSFGGNFYKTLNKTADYTVTLTDNFITIDATGGNVTLTLPAASTAFGNNTGIDYTFKRLDNSGNTVTIQRAGSDLIDGATTFTLTTQYQAKSLRAISTSAWGIY